MSRTRFQFYAGVEGRFLRPAVGPQDVVEIMITEALAEELGLQVGDDFHVEDSSGGAHPSNPTAPRALFREQETAIVTA